MIVMPANNTGFEMGWLAGKYGQLGWLMSPGGWRQPKRGLPYALDNGAFPAWTNGKPWNEDAFIQLLESARLAPYPPLWVIAPDVVTDRLGTITRWIEWRPALRDYGWPLAFAVQDGMTQADVPPDADVIFVGGSTEWKRDTVLQWCRNNPRVHVGRVNDYDFLRECHKAGVESCDGTGWFRGDQAQLGGLERYLEESKTGRWAQLSTV